jgi:hypothetical protein
MSLFRRKPPKPPKPQMIAGWNAPKADQFLAHYEARALTKELVPGLLRWGGTVSQHKADMGEINTLVAIADDIGVPVVITADIYDSTPQEAVQRIKAHLDAGVKVAGVELGNETYLQQYRDRIASPEEYMAKARALRDAIRAAVPSMPCGIVMAPTASMRDPDSAGVHPKYLTRWNEVVMRETWPDAVVLHAYVNPQRTGPSYVDHANAVATLLASLSPRRVWLTEVGVQGECPAEIRKDHYNHMLQVAANAHNADIFCWHSLAGGGSHAAIHVTADRRGGVKAQYSEFGAAIAKA